MGDYFKNDEYWRERINKKLESDIWIDEYKQYFEGKGKCLDLGCGIGQFSKILMEYGYDVISADISDIALNKVKEFNKSVVKVDMQEKLPFEDDSFDLVFANLSIHFFSDKDTKKLMLEIKRILKQGGLFVGSVNGIQGYDHIKETATEIEYHYYENNNRNIRLFEREDLIKYLSVFEIMNIEDRETIRFEHKKNYLIFICKKD